MITIKEGDLLKIDCDIICHQVNLQGVMGGGIAAQIARKYPECEKEYKKYIQSTKNAFGKVFLWYNGEIYIANCFTQTEFFYTRYDSVRNCFEEIARFAEKKGLSVGIPYKYGCGIANGSWEEVEQIIIDVFANKEIDCKILKL